jgi:hypothetical protein
LPPTPRDIAAKHAASPIIAAPRGGAGQCGDAPAFDRGEPQVQLGVGDDEAGARSDIAGWRTALDVAQGREHRQTGRVGDRCVAAK